MKGKRKRGKKAVRCVRAPIYRGGERGVEMKESMAILFSF